MADTIDLFPVDEQNTEDLFPTIPTSTNQYSDKYTQDRAFYGALATEGMSGDEAFQSIIDRNKELIDQGKDNIIEKQAAFTRSQRSNETNLGIQRDLLFTPQASPLINFFEEQRQARAATDEKNSLEKEAMQKYQDLSVEDPYQAAVYLDRLKNGDLLDRQANYATKLAIFQREQDKLAQRLKEQGLGTSVLNFFSSMIDIPLEEISKTLNLQDPNVALDSNQKLLSAPAAKVNRQAMSLWDPNISVDEFSDMVEKASQHVTDHSGFLMNNNAVALDEFSRLRGINDEDALGYNAWAAFNVATAPGAGVLAKAVSNPIRFAEMVGNRAAAVRGVAGAVLEPGEDAALNAKAVADSLPTGIVPNSPDFAKPYVGLSGDVAAKVEALRSLKDEAMNIITPERAAPEQYAEAVAKKADELANRFKDENVVDIKKLKPAEVVTETPKTDNIVKAYQDYATREAQDKAEGFTVEAYHGTNKDFEGFDTSKINQRSKAIGGGFYFSDTPDMASTFATTVLGDEANFTVNAERTLKSGKTVSIPNKVAEGANVLPVRLRLTNPLKVDLTGQTVSPELYQPYIDQAKKAGNDGVIFTGVNERLGKADNVYLVFDPKNIRGKFGGLSDLGLETGSTSASRKVTASLRDELAQDEATLGVGQSKRIKTGPNGKLTQDQITADLKAKGIKPDIRSRFDLQINPDTGIRSLALYLGKKTGQGGYITEQAAKNAAETRGFSLQDVEITPGIDGRYYIKTVHNVPENGIVTPYLKEADFPLTSKIATWIKNPDNVAAQSLSELRHLSEGAKSRLSAKVIRPLVREVKHLTKSQTNDMNAILTLGEKEQKWYSPEELVFNYERYRGVAPTKQEVVAYYAVKELNDFDWKVRNRQAYITRARQGYETIKIDDGGDFNTGRRNGIVVQSSELAGKRIYDLEEHVGYAPGSADDVLKEKLDTGNYSIIRLEGTYNYSNEEIKYIIANNNSFTRGPLETQQLGYIAGGHRLYRDKWFVKQANSQAFKDGTSAWLNPLTHIVAKTQGQAAKWAAGMEKARLAWVDYTKGVIDADVAEKIIGENSSLDLAKFTELVDAKQINPRHKFEVVYDRTQPSEMTGVGENNLWVDEWHDGTDQWYNTNGRMYYSAKGERLKNPFDEYAEILDPFDGLQKSINNALNTRAMGDYTTHSIEEWARLASPYIKKGLFGENPDKRRLFYDGQFDEDFVRNNPNFHSALEANREVIKRFLGQQTMEMSYKEIAARRLAAVIENGKYGTGVLPEKAREYLAGKAMDMMDSNPVSAVRGLVFDTQLGFFDPGQFIVQTQTALATAALDPKNGPAAVAMWPAIRLVGTNLNPSVLDYVAKNLKFLHGLDPEEFKTMIKTMMTTGEYDISGDLIELSHWANTTGGNSIAKATKDFREQGRVIFNEAEKLNRTVAWQLAWKDVRKRLPNLDITSKEFAQAVKLKASDFGISMRYSSAAGWQKGIASIPTQFMSYQMRMLEAMLPKEFGGNPRLNGGQKFQLALSQALLYGTTGLPVLNWVGEQWKANRGEDLSPDGWRLVTKGLWDSFFYYTSGGEADLDFAARAGVGQAWSQTIEKLINGDMNSVLSVMGGPIGTVTGDFFDSFKKIAEYGRAGIEGGFLSQEAFGLIMGDLAKNINVLERAHQAALIWRYGKAFDRQGRPIADASQIEGLAAALGINIRETRESYDLLEQSFDRQEEIKDVAKILSKINDDFFRAMENGNEKDMEQAQRLRAGILQSYANDPLYQQQIAAEAIKLQTYTQDRMGYARQRYQDMLGKENPTDKR